VRKGLPGETGPAHAVRRFSVAPGTIRGTTTCANTTAKGNASVRPVAVGSARKFWGHPVVTILIAFVLFGPVVGLGFQLIPQIIAGLAGQTLPDGGALPTESGPLTALSVGKFITAILLALFSLWLYRTVIVRFCEGRSVATELAFTPTARKWLIIGTLLSVGVAALTIGSIAILGDGVSSVAGSPVVAGLAWSLGLAIFAGVVEELLARGAIFRVSEQHLGSAIAFVITSVIFALQHAGNPDATLLSTLAVGIEGGTMLAAVYALTRTLWAPIAVHAAWNFSQSILTIPVSGNETVGAIQLQLSGPDWLTGGSFGLEPAALALGLWTLLTVVLLAMVAKRKLGISLKVARANVADGTGNQPIGISS